MAGLRSIFRSRTARRLVRRKRLETLVAPRLAPARLNSARRCFLCSIGVQSVAKSAAPGDPLVGWRLARARVRGGVSRAELRPSRLALLDRQTKRRPRQALFEPSSTRVRGSAFDTPSDVCPASGGRSAGDTATRLLARVGAQPRPGARAESNDQRPERTGEAWEATFALPRDARDASADLFHTPSIFGRSPSPAAMLLSSSPCSNRSRSRAWISGRDVRSGGWKTLPARPERK